MYGDIPKCPPRPWSLGDRYSEQLSVHTVITLSAVHYILTTNIQSSPRFTDCFGFSHMSIEVILCEVSLSSIVPRRSDTMCYRPYSRYRDQPGLTRNDAFTRYTRTSRMNRVDADLPFPVVKPDAGVDCSLRISQPQQRLNSILP